MHFETPPPRPILIPGPSKDSVSRRPTPPLGSVSVAADANVPDVAQNGSADASAMEAGVEGQSAAKDKLVVWLDIDNTLYRRSTRIADLMGERIHAYFLSLGLDEHEAARLHQTYYREYGLALRGLVRHHKIDPLHYDKMCDASLPLEQILKPDMHLQKLLKDMDRSKVRVLALTNAYKDHALRVLRILGLDEYVEAIVYADYSAETFNCKPEKEFYIEAMRLVGTQDPSKQYFVDDSAVNVRAAKELGWGSAVHFAEDPAECSIDVGDAQISDLEELRHIWGDKVFRSSSDDS